MSCPKCDYLAELATHTADTIKAALLPETPPHSGDCPKAMRPRALGVTVNSHPHNPDPYGAELLRGVLSDVESER